MNTIDDNFVEGVKKFLNTLSKNQFEFKPVQKGSTKSGTSLNLGFSCYAIKILHIIREFDTRDDKSEWIDYINNFQTSNFKKFPSNSFIDENYVKSFNRNPLLVNFKYILKKYLKPQRYKPKSEVLNEFILAETKQAISTLKQIGSNNRSNYFSNFLQEDKLQQYIDTLDWSTPWTSGAQLANLMFILETQKNENSENLKQIFQKTVDNLADAKTGMYFKGTIKNEAEIINGAMKIISGMDWLNLEIHYPKKIIDFCLNHSPKNFGCDIVDLVYVIYKSSKQLNNSYKYIEINEYFNDILKKIYENYFPDLGGFSYFKNKSQIHYYGVKISKGFDEPDIHGTLLLLWAISMISDFRNENTFNILKP